MDRLAAEEPCLGAVFLSYTFDPAFFEEQVLRALLRLASDPVEQSTRFYEEACRALQEVPIACFVDAGARRPGRRLPYDLTLCHGRTFHPKLVLALYEGYARVMVGSANVTPSGFSENAELVSIEDLAYDQTADVATLLEVASFLEKVREAWRPVGRQLDLVLDELRRRITDGGCSDVGRDAPRRIAFLHGEDGKPLLDQLLALVPATSRVMRVGLLAPFYESDDPGVENVADVTSVLARLATCAGSSSITMDVGVQWMQSPLHAPAAGCAALEDGVGDLWASRNGDQDAASVDYWTLQRVHPSTVQLVDGHGVSRRAPRVDVEDRIRTRATWHIGMAQIHAPRALIAAILDYGVDLQLWLHPTRRLELGQPASRPLHAKFLLLTWRGRNGAPRTLVFVGSANASRRALLCSSADGGNVECGFAFVVDGEVHLKDIAPELVWADPDRVRCTDRTYPVHGPDIGLAVEGAVYDAVLRTLVVRWRLGAGAVSGFWTLSYDRREIARGEGTPEGGALVIEPFELVPTTLELVLRIGGEEASIPIIVEDLAGLRLGLATYEPDLREMLALLGRRVSDERMAMLYRDGHGNVVPRVLDQIFGEEFGAHDVFRAWWGLAADLSDPCLSVVGFRLHLDGGVGARAVWRCLRESVSIAAMSNTEAWFYGAELLRALLLVELPDDETGRAKRLLLDGFTVELRNDLVPFRPEGDAAWLRSIAAFYPLDRAPRAQRALATEAT